jgi:plastocyanin
MFLINKSYLPLILLMITIGFNSCQKAENPGPNEVFIQNKNFYPQQLAIPAGTKVTWTNKDALNHTVTSNSNLFDSGKMDKDGTFSYTFNTHGIYDYRCNYYNCTGVIIVK